MSLGKRGWIGPTRKPTLVLCAIDILPTRCVLQWRRLGIVQPIWICCVMEQMSRIFHMMIVGTVGLVSHRQQSILDKILTINVLLDTLVR